ncbi:MAG: HIT family protein [Chloroflexi bacterium]|nr:HIT family protein [Chloroflexota bacterium]
MASCIFCEIVANRQPASFVYRDELCAAFMDIQPVTRGHLLVIPNRHAAFLVELDPRVGGHLFAVAQRLAQALRESEVRCEGINLFLADGTVAGQEVFHVHLHVIPRHRGDGFGLRFPPDYGRRPPRHELDAVAESIRAAL